MEYYNRKIAGNPRLEMIHVSYDATEAHALRWAKRKSFPWPTVLATRRDAAGLGEFAKGDVPEYILVRKDGRVIANGKEKCLTALSRL